MYLSMLKKEFWFSKVEAAHIDEFRVWIGKRLALAHFEVVIKDEEFWEIGRKRSTKNIFPTFMTDFQTEAPAQEHHLRNCSQPN